jgi:S1-C subfamily serine protease
MHPEYHRPADDAGKIDAKGMEKAARLAARLVEEIAKAPDRPAFVRADSGGEPPRAVLGIVAEAAPGGVRIGRLQPEAPAALAGLERGDLIVAVGGEATPDLGALRDVLERKSPGDGVKVRVRRGGKEIEVDLRLAKG